MTKDIKKIQEENRKLQDEADKYKLLWETACEGAMVIITEQEEEIKQLKERLDIAIDYLDSSLPAVGKNGSIPRLAAENILTQIKGKTK